MKAYYYRCNDAASVRIMVELCQGAYDQEIVHEVLDCTSGILLSDEGFYDCLVNVLPLLIHDTGTSFTFLAAYDVNDLAYFALDKACLYCYEKCTHLSDCLLECILHQDMDLNPYIKKYFSQVPRDILQCAMEYVMCGCNACLAANKLYVHRNTFNYRLDKFIQCTHLNIKDFHNAMFFYLAYKILFY